jgi:aspartate carbamoyltransferase catalytic subunit
LLEFRYKEIHRCENLRGRDIISARDLSREDLEAIFKGADSYGENPGIYRDMLKGKTVALIFIEPSTRTYHSFEKASRILGCEVIGIRDPSISSMAKGENLYDTIKMIESYGADLIVIRHPSRGAALYAAEISSVPVINGGDGSREHPTQAILDLYTIYKERIDRWVKNMFSRGSQILQNSSLPKLCSNTLQGHRDLLYSSANATD